MRDGVKPLSTWAIHGVEPKKGEEIVIPPIHLSTTYRYVGNDKGEPVRYTRLSNTPEHLRIGQKLAALEGAEAALVTASGMAAISTALLALVPIGKRVLCHRQVYGATSMFLSKDFLQMGRKVAWYQTEQELEALLLQHPNEIAVVYAETISNPLLARSPIERIATLAKKHGALAIIDNTFASPVNVRPIELGADVVVHSATKYLNGHTDVTAGVVASSFQRIKQVSELLKHLGGFLAPFEIYLLERGLKTLVPRVQWQNRSAQQLSEFLSTHAKVQKVYYPGFGGMVAFEYKGTESELFTALERFQLIAIAPSLGGVESLLTLPAQTTHSWVSAKDREEMGIKPTLVRVSVGLEEPEELIEDFKRAL